MATTLVRDEPVVAADARTSDRDARVTHGQAWSSAALALLVWVALVGVSVAWGEHLISVVNRLQIHAPPLTGRYEWRIGVDAIAAVVVAVTVVVAGPRLSRRRTWTQVLVLVALGALAWAVALAVVDGSGALTDPLRSGKYLQTVPRVGNPFTFLSQFTDRIATYNVDTQGHPPGMVLGFWVLDRFGFGSVGWNAVLVFGGGAAAAVAALVALRELSGEALARTAAPFAVIVPAAIWWTSGDAFFSAVVAWGVTLVVLSTGRSGRRADALALSGGLLLGATAFLSYGLVLLVVVPIAVALSRRRIRPLVLAALGAAPVFLLFLAAGFWWFAGLAATHARYYAGVASRRPYSYFVIGDLGAFAMALGPAIAVALAWLRDRRAWLLVGAALLAVGLADLSGMSKAEVERIWLPFVPWVVLAAAAFGATGARPGGTRWRTIGPWLALQAATGLLVEVAVRSPW